MGINKKGLLVVLARFLKRPKFSNCFLSKVCNIFIRREKMMKNDAIIGLFLNIFSGSKFDKV